MSGFFKNKNKFSMALGALFLAVVLIAGTLVYATGNIATPVNNPDGLIEEMDGAPENEIEPDDTVSTDDEDDDGDIDSEYAIFNVPSEMRGTYLVPGVDFMKTKDTSEATIRSEIDKAFENARALTINSVIVDTTYNDEVIYKTKDAPELATNFDMLEYIIEKARQENFFTYAIFDTSLYPQQQMITALAIGAGAADRLCANLGEFCEKYDLDGILLDGYQNEGSEESYNVYLNIGGGIGFLNFMRQSPYSVVKSASNVIRSKAPSTQVGILADAVWENSTSDELGSKTQAAFTSLSNANADTKGFVEKGLVDFVAVKAYTTTTSATVPFEEVVKWWADVSLQNDIPMYIVHASSKIGSGEGGWQSQDELIKQVIQAAEVSGFRGSVFDNLQKLAASGTNVSSNLTKFYKNEVEPEQILTQLEMTKPENTTFTTSEPQVTFTGASDPDQPVTINDKKIETDESGYFTVQMPLKAGANSFVIKHKDRTLTYSVTRKIEILKSAAPMGDIITDGGMSVRISAVAYQDATVSATFNGITIQMSPDDQLLEDEQDRDSSFRTFTGQFTVPAATSEVQNLGKIVVSASYEGESNSLQCGSVKVNKKAKLEDGVAIRVTADQALTYPPNTLDNIPVAKYYPLPAGAMDYAVGDEITYKKDGVTYNYFVLSSGMRVESKDIVAITNDYPGNNAISGLSVKSENGYTYVTVKTAQKVSYSVSYASSGMTFEFHHTTSFPDDMSLSKNPLFDSAVWNSNKLTLTFVKSGSFMGYKGYYDNSGNLVLRFRNPPSSISGARIAIDPGHGGKDTGALGFLNDYPEKTINAAIASYLASELESRGATVNLMNNSGIEGQQRKEAAESWGADIFISVHCNSAPNINATGTEVYYFYPFSSKLAANASSSVSSGLSTTNRGAKQSYYHVTLSPQFMSVLVECGFMTNKAEYEKLISKKYQKNIAAGIADGISSTIKGTYSGAGGSGSESVGNGADTDELDQTANQDQDTNSTNTSSAVLEDIYLKSAHSINAGKSTTLIPEVHPENAKDYTLTWKSSNTSVLTVDDNGKITGKKEGTANVTVTAKGNSKISSVCTVTVRPSDSPVVKVTGVELSETDLVLTVGEGATLYSIISPDDADNVAVTWRSNKSSVATVSSTGRVTAVAEGEATITVSTQDGSKKATCEVYVSGKSGTAGGTAAINKTDSGVPLSSVHDAYFDYDYTIYPGNSVRAEVISNAGEVIRGGDFKWSSEDTSVATVDSKGWITAKSVGETEIYAVGGGYELVCWVTVSKDKVKVTGIELDKSKVTVVRNGNATLKATISPTYATNMAVTWSTSNSKVATVSSSGVVTGKAAGKATITVKSKDGSYTAKCEVEVLKSAIKVEEVDIYEDTLELLVGYSDTIDYEIYPEDATNQGVKWSSSNPSVATVDENGKVTTLKKGTAVITCTSAENSKYKDKVTIKVID